LGESCALSPSAAVPAREDAGSLGANQRADMNPAFGLLNVAGGSYRDLTTTCRVVIED